MALTGADPRSRRRGVGADLRVRRRRGLCAERSRAASREPAGSAPVAVAATSAAVTAAVLDLEAALAVEESGQVALLQTADFREGVAAFLEKRAARFQGH